MTDLEIQTWIENNMYHEDGTPMIDVQTFYEGAKWMRNQALSIGAVSQRSELLEAFLDEYIEAWDDGMAGSSSLLHDAKKLKGLL